METGFKLDIATMPPIALAVLMGSGLSWSIAYVLIIRKSARDKTFGMPMTALCANLTWEFIFSFVQPHPFPIVLCNYAWLALDFVLAYQFLRYGREDFVRNLSLRWFYPLIGFIVAVSAAAILILARHFDDEGWHAGILINILMSPLFVGMELRRDSVERQSLGIADAKFVGTQLAILGFSLNFPVPPLILWMWVLILVFALTYVSMVYAKSRQLGVAAPAPN